MADRNLVVKAGLVESLLCNQDSFIQDFPFTRFCVSQLPSLEHGSAQTNDVILEEAIAETAKVLYATGSTLGQKSAYNGDEVEIQDAMMETVKALRGGQSSFVRKKTPSNAQKRRQFWDKFHSSGFAKALKKDGMAIKSWLQAVQPQKKSPKTGVTNILANDIDYVKRNSTLVGPSFSKKVGEIVALRIIEDESAVPAAPAFWPKPYYPGMSVVLMIVIIYGDWNYIRFISCSLSVSNFMQNYVVGIFWLLI